MVAKKTAVRKAAARDAATSQTGVPAKQAAVAKATGGTTSRTAPTPCEPAGRSTKDAVPAKKTAADPPPDSGTASTEPAGSAGRASRAGTSAGVPAAPAKTGVGDSDRRAGAGKARSGAATQQATSGRQVAKKTALRKTGAKKVAPKKTTPRSTVQSAVAVPAARPAGAPAEPDELAVRPGEDPWTSAEVEEALMTLEAEVGRLRAELLASEKAISGLMRDSGDGAGDDQADTGSKNITREHELALADNAREMLRQTERALERLAAGTYGLCESCGTAIGKARMQAFSRATLCVGCKQRQERH